MIIKENEVTNYRAGIFLSDRNGLAFENTTHASGNGIFLCTAQGTFLPDGTSIIAPEPSNKWVISRNHSFDNFNGYLARDGAFDNLFIQNEGGNNLRYDFRLRGNIYDSNGNLREVGSSDLTVISIGNDLSDLLILDCGENNTIIGGTLVEPTADVCP